MLGHQQEHMFFLTEEMEQAYIWAGFMAVTDFPNIVVLWTALTLPKYPLEDP